LLIDIPPGTHHYKYIVDSEWRLDEDAPTVQIAAVWNNVVEVKRPVFEYTPQQGEADSDDEEGGVGDERKQKTAYGQRQNNTKHEERTARFFFGRRLLLRLVACCRFQ
jgi:hypothetical protein